MVSNNFKGDDHNSKGEQVGDVEEAKHLPLSELKLNITLQTSWTVVLQRSNWVAENRIWVL